MKRMVLLTAILALAPARVHAEEAAYILVYHHVSQATPASTSVTPEQFASHMDYLANNNYQVVPMPRLLGLLADKSEFNPKLVAITFDDAYRSVLSNALPILQQHKWPFTVFVSTDAIDAGQPAHLTWQELRLLADSGGTIANHSRTHLHMPSRKPEESTDTWRARIRDDIEYAQARLEAELPAPPRILAYPYGEFDEPLTALVAEMEFFAVGQQSGPVGRAGNPHTVPRFPIATGYADLRSFAEKLHTRALPVANPRTPASVLTDGAQPPTLELEISPVPARLEQLTCFVSGQEPALITWQDRSAGKLSVTARQPLGVGRSKYTCTAPHEQVPGAYYWYSYLWMLVNSDGNWYEG